MACPKCGNDSIEILDENTSGTINRVIGGFGVIGMGIFLMGIPILGLILIIGGIAIMFSKKTKTIKCTKCGYTKVMSQQ